MKKKMIEKSPKSTFSVRLRLSADDKWYLTKGIKCLAGLLLAFFLLPFVVANDCYKENRWPWEI